MEIKEEMEIKKENENYVLGAVTRYYSNDISGICSFIEDKKDKEDEDKDDKTSLISKIWLRKKKEEKDKDDKEVNDKDDKEEDDDTELKRFIILNFRGIYNFEFDDDFDFFNLNEKFEYPQSIRRELDNW